MGLTATDVAAELAAEILTLPVGARIASEHELMRRFGIGRSIARAALRILEERHVVRRVQGAGTFVHRRTDLKLSARVSPSLHYAAQAAEVRIKTVVKLLEPEKRSSIQAKCRQTKISRVVRLAYIENSLAGYLEDWVSREVVADLDVILGRYGSLTALLAGSGRKPAVGAGCVTVQQAPEPVSTALEIDGATVCWVQEAHVIDHESREFLMYSKRWFRPDLIRLIVEY